MTRKPYEKPRLFRAGLFRKKTGFNRGTWFEAPLRHMVP